MLTPEKQAKAPVRIDPYPMRPSRGYSGPITTWRWTPETRLGGLPADGTKTHDSLVAAIYAIAKTQEE